MTDKLTKELRKLTKKQLDGVEDIVRKLKTGETSGLNIKKLKGSTDIYRARKGNLRIIFSKSQNDIELIQVSKRDDQTYSQY